MFKKKSKIEFIIENGNTKKVVRNYENEGYVPKKINNYPRISKSQILDTFGHHFINFTLLSAFSVIFYRRIVKPIKTKTENIMTVWP